MRKPTLTPTDIIIIVCTIGLIMKYGKLKFNFTESATILDRDKNDLGAYLHDHGVTVERRGTKKCSPKYVHVADLARVAADKSENVAAIRND